MSRYTHWPRGALVETVSSISDVSLEETKNIKCLVVDLSWRCVLVDAVSATSHGVNCDLRGQRVEVTFTRTSGNLDGLIAVYISWEYEFPGE